jgi:DNA-directed RNA polymerase II subunit RPB1
MEEFQGDLKCWHSDDNAENLIILVRIVAEDKDDMDIENRIEEDIFLRRIEHNILNDIVLCGIKGISRVFISEAKLTGIDPVTDVLRAENPEYFLETDGTNLVEILSHLGVDSYRTYSNCSNEIYSVLGIEAARAALLKEMRKVIEFDGSYVNYRHLALLIDIMTTRGYLMAISRHGINRTEVGALARSSFEETVELLLEAAGSGEVDNCRGVSESVMLGQVPHLGTGGFGVLLDEEALLKAPLSQVFEQQQGVMFMDRSFAMTPAHTPFMDHLASPMDSPMLSPFNMYQVEFSPIGADGRLARPGSPAYGAGSPSSPGYRYIF